MKVLVSDPLAEEAIERLKKESDIEVDVKTGMDKEELKKTIKDYAAIIVRSATKVTREVIGNADNLKVIARAGVGLDNIDLDAAKEKGIKVVNTPGGTTISVAELTFGLMLASTRNITRADASLKEKKWEKKKLGGFELYGKTLGIIGLGRIGREVAKRAKGFGMKIVAYDPYVKKEEIPDIDVELVSMDDILKNSDFITLHIPAIPQTRHIISEAEIAKMKDGVVLINAARGGVVDEEAVYNGLTSKKIKCAAFDVFEVEPPLESKLLELDNFIATPHLGASTVEGQIRAGVEAADKVVGILRG